MDSRESAKRRSDWPLIKHLSKTYSPRLGWGWQRLPYIDIPELVQSEIEARHATVYGDHWDSLHLPFEDFVLHWVSPAEPWRPADRGRVDAWIRIEMPYSGERAKAIADSPWVMQALKTPALARETQAAYDRINEIGDLEHWFMCHTFQANQGDMIGPLSFALFAQEGMLRTNAEKAVFYNVPMSPLACQLAGEAEVDGGAARVFGDWIKADVGTAVMLAQYCAVCPEYLVEEAWSDRARPAPTHPKPWTFSGLSTIILLDPTKAPSGEPSAYLGGTHASPRPHQRRGHWAALKHPKFRRSADGSIRKVFVKPAWVGPKEWVMEGNRYRVIESESA